MKLVKTKIVRKDLNRKRMTYEQGRSEQRIERQELHLINRSSTTGSGFVVETLLELESLKVRFSDRINLEEYRKRNTSKGQREEI